MTSVRFAAGICAGLLWAAGALAQGTGAGSDANADRTPASDRAGQAASDVTAGAQHTAHAAGQKAKAAGQQLTSGDARTLARLHAGNQAEVEAGNWMKEHATDSKVKDYAEKMVDDHTSMDKDLDDLAQKQGISLTGSATAGAGKKREAEHHLASIKKMQGAQADQAYMQMMVRDHQKDVSEVRQAHQQAQQSGKTELASLLEKTASKMEDHLKDARDISKNLTKQARGGSSSTSGTGSGQQK